jgi:phospholipase/lecithinase/hemolysin
MLRVRLTKTNREPERGSFLNPGGETGPFARFDSIHPTTEAHRQIATYVRNQVPESATMLLMAFGLFTLAGLRRRFTM